MMSMTVAVLVSGCGSDSTGPNGGDDSTGPDGEIQALTVTPSSAPPGAVIHISGVDEGSTDGDVGLLVGGEPAVILPNGGDGWVASVPLFVDGDGGSTPPGGPVDVTLTAAGEPVGERAKALTVEALQPAPGSAEQLLARLTEATNALVDLSDAAAGPASREEQYRFAISRTLSQIVSGDDPQSLRSQIDSIAEDPEVLALLDAFVASSSMLPAVDHMAIRFEHLVGNLGAAWRGLPDPNTAASVVAPEDTITLTDGQLAAKMQEYEYVTLFGKDVVTGTATWWGNIVGLGGGALGLGLPSAYKPNKLKAVQKVGLILAVLDFLTNKVYLGFLPANVDDLTLELARSQLSIGEVTDATVEVVASNDPPSIKYLDLLSYVTTVFGGPFGDETVVEQIADLVFSYVQSYVSQYANLNEGAIVDNEVATAVPEMAWRATIEDFRMLDRLTTAPAVVDAELTDVDWRAYAAGEAEIWARSTQGLLFIDPLPGTDFNTGVFGDQLDIETNRVTVEVTEALSFAGSYVGTYDASGGCNDDSQSGTIEFQIGQDGSTLAVSYSLNPDFEGLTVYGGEAEIITETPRSFIGTITEPSQLQGTFDGTLSEDGTEISGMVEGTAQTLCGGMPAEVDFSGSYEGTRQ